MEGMGKRRGKGARQDKRPLQQPEFPAKLPAKVLVKEMNFFLCPKYVVCMTKKNSRRKRDHRPPEMLTGNEPEFRLSRNRFRRNSPPFLFVLLSRMTTRKIVLSSKVLKASSSDTCQAIKTSTWKETTATKTRSSRIQLALQRTPRRFLRTMTK